MMQRDSSNEELDAPKAAALRVRRPSNPLVRLPMPTRDPNNILVDTPVLQPKQESQEKQRRVQSCDGDMFANSLPKLSEIGLSPRGASRLPTLLSSEELNTFN